MRLYDFVCTCVSIHWLYAQIKVSKIDERWREIERTTIVLCYTILGKYSLKWWCLHIFFLCCFFSFCFKFQWFWFLFVFFLLSFEPFCFAYVACCCNVAVHLSSSLPKFILLRAIFEEGTKKETSQPHNVIASFSLGKHTSIEWFDSHYTKTTTETEKNIHYISWCVFKL